MPAILFDLDGTLHDRNRGLLDFSSAQFSKLGGDTSLRDRFVSRFIELDANGKVWKDEVYRRLLQEFEFGGRHTVDGLVADYVSSYPQYAREMPGATDALQALVAENLRIGIVSNGRGDLQRAVIEALGFAHYVDTIVISSEVGFRKPRPEIFAVALDRLGAAAGDTVMVGDDQGSDVDGALGAGICPIGFQCSSTPTGIVVVQSLEEAVHKALPMLKGIRS